MYSSSRITNIRWLKHELAHLFDTRNCVKLRRPLSELLPRTAISALQINRNNRYNRPSTRANEYHPSSFLFGPPRKHQCLTALSTAFQGTRVWHCWFVSSHSEAKLRLLQICVRRQILHAVPHCKYANASIPIARSIREPAYRTTSIKAIQHARIHLLQVDNVCVVEVNPLLLLRTSTEITQFITLGRIARGTVAFSTYLTIEADRSVFILALATHHVRGESTMPQHYILGTLGLSLCAQPTTSCIISGPHGLSSNRVDRSGSPECSWYI